MQVTGEELQHLSMVEAILVEHRAFGDSDYIHQQLHACYKRRLRKISAYLPVAGLLLDKLTQITDRKRYLVIGDTVVRCAIDHALEQIELGIRSGLSVHECEEIFNATIHHINEGVCSGPLERGIENVGRLGSETYHGWVWDDGHSLDVFGRAFRKLMVYNNKGDLTTLGADEHRMLQMGAQLLRQLLPSLSRSALSHAHLIAVFPWVDHWKGKGSSSQSRLGGTIFLSGAKLESPWWVAEHLFHESLHQKLYDFRGAHSVFRDGSQLSRETAKRLCSIWNVQGPNKSNCWDRFRSVTAFHVYVHLGLLCRLAELCGPGLEAKYGPIRGMTPSRIAMDRAHYLGEQIGDKYEQELGLAGRGLIEWLRSVLDALDPFPPPQGAYLHLLLPRYLREATIVENLQAWEEKGKPEGGRDITMSGFQEQLKNVITDEVKSIGPVLSSVGADGDLCRLKEAAVLYSASGAEKQFADVRRLIAKAIHDVSANGYRLKCPWMDEVVKRMVDSSSERLVYILAK